MKLALGTVQFGMDYGVSNNLGKTSNEEVVNILAEAGKSNITLIDTAALYGDSEKVLGKTISDSSLFNIVTKSPVYHGKIITKRDVDLLTDVFKKSLELLNCENVYGLLIHHAADLFAPGGESLIEAMSELKSQGLVHKIGVSLYDGQTIDRVLELFTPDIVQLPINIADQRLIVSGNLEKLKNYGVEIHARSLFLQGLLLMNISDISEHFNPIKYYFENLEQFSINSGMSRLEMCLDFGSSCKEIDRLVVGVTNADELKELVEVTRRIDNNKYDYSSLSLVEEEYLDPSKWK